MDGRWIGRESSEKDAQQCIKLRRDYSRGWLLLASPSAFSLSKPIFKDSFTSRCEL